MQGEHHHDLAKEFPQHKARIHELKVSDHHFAKLLADYEEVSKEIYRIEEGIETPSDEYTEEQKKKRLHLKDELYAMLMKN